MKTDKELLEDTSFDREICPRDEFSDFLMLLFEHKYFDENNAAKCYKWDITKEIKDAIKRKLIKKKKCDKKDHKLWLTAKGKIVAAGEYALRQREKKNELNDKKP